MNALARALGAQKVAVFGASATPGKWGYIVPDQLLREGFEGEVVLVNPKGGTVFGLPLSDASAAAGADLAVTVTPPSTIPGIAEQCGELGIDLLVVESAGFGEVGERDVEAELVRRAKDSGVRLIGPNCLGLFVGPTRLNLTTLPNLPVGHVSFVSQSGGLSLQVGRRLHALGAGFDVLLSLGNKVDIGFADALEVLGARPETQAVLLYLERPDEGDALFDQVAQLSATVPVIALVGGRTNAGQGAAFSHTGSIVSRWDRVAGLLESAGARIADSLALATAAAAGGRRGSRQPAKRVFALVDGGGHAVLLADALAAAGYELPIPPPELAAILEADGRRVSNPLDFAGVADDDPEVYSRTLAPILESGFYDAVVIGGIFGGYEELFGSHLARAELRAAEAIGDIAGKHAAPVILQSVYATEPSAALAAVRSRGVACLEWPEEVVAVLSGRTVSVPLTLIAEPDHDFTERADMRLAERTAHVLAVLEEGGVAHALGRLVSRDELPVDRGPWVLRLDGFAHKARAGAIRLGVIASELPDTYDELAAVAVRAGIEPRIRIAPMVSPEHELMLTFWRSEGEGNGWVVGAGGTRVEELADVAIGRLPRSEEDVNTVLAKTRLGSALLAEGTVVSLFAPFVLKLADVFETRLGDLRELECNPVALTKEEAIVLDVLPTIALTVAAVIPS